MRHPIYVAADSTLFEWGNGEYVLESNGSRMNIPKAVADAVAQGQYDDSDRFVSIYLNTLKNCSMVSKENRGAVLSQVRYPNRRFLILNWAITGRCNLSCRHCFMAKDLNPTSFEPSLERCLSFLDDVVRCGIRTVRLSGGEPLIHKHFDEIVQGIAERGLHLESIATNGMFLAEHLPVIEGCGFSPRIDVSYDGIGVHDWMRARTGAEKETLAAIELARNAGLSVKIQYSLYSGNKDALMPTAQTLDAIGVDCLRINRLGESERWLAGGNGPCLSSSEYYDFAERFVRAFLDTDIQMKLHFWSYAYLEPRMKTCKTKAAVSPYGELRASCNACDSVRRMIAVSPEGEVAPCAQVFGFLAADKSSWGNAYRDGLEKALSDSQAADYSFATIADVKNGSPECSSCEWFSYCGGGCRAVAFGLTRDYFAKDPTRCDYFLNGHHEELLSMMASQGYSVC